MKNFTIVATCKNNSDELFTSAKILQLVLLSQDVPERITRVIDTVALMEKKGLGACTYIAAFEPVAPKMSTLSKTAKMNAAYFLSSLGGQSPELELFW